MKDHVVIDERLASMPLFQGLSKRELELVATISTRMEFEPGKVLAREGDRGNEFILLLDGTVEVRHDDHVVATRGPNDYIGEISLLTGRPRTATVVTATPVTAEVIAAARVPRAARRGSRGVGSDARHDAGPARRARGMNPEERRTLPACTTGSSGTVTFLFTDLEGSTRLWEDFPDAMQTRTGAARRAPARRDPGARRADREDDGRRCARGLQQRTRRTRRRGRGAQRAITAEAWGDDRAASGADRRAHR